MQADQATGCTSRLIGTTLAIVRNVTEQRQVCKRLREMWRSASCVHTGSVNNLVCIV